MVLKKIKVLIIDDSALIRETLKKIFARDSEIEVIGSSIDPLHAIKVIKQEKPDVITLDLQMPRMDGLTFLEKLMVSFPIPVVVVSSLAQKGSIEAVRALELGAVDVIAKPTIGIDKGLIELADEIILKVKNAANVNKKLLNRFIKRKKIEGKQTEKNSKEEPEQREAEIYRKSTIKLIVVGASTGGTLAIRYVLEKLPVDIPGIIVVLHMPHKFTESYAKSLDAFCKLKVKEAVNGEAVKPGTVYITPGGHHLTVEKGVTGYFLAVEDSPPINYYRPSIDKTFISVAEKVSPNSIGVILTGMGDDGAKGLKKMHDRGSITIAQDESSSIVFGMPKKAIESGGVNHVLSLDNIADAILKIVKGL